MALVFHRAAALFFLKSRRKALVAALGPVLSNAAEGPKLRSRNADFSLGGKPRPGPLVRSYQLQAHSLVHARATALTFAWAFVVNSICLFDRGRYGVFILELFLGLPQIAAIRTIWV